MNWFGLNWLDILINVVALAIIPGLLAAYGGHLAAEAIDNPARSRRVKLCFWLLFLFGVVVTAVQQIRAAQADQARVTSELWEQALIANKSAPPPPAYIEQTPDVPRSYLVFDGNIRFPERKDSTGQLLPEQHLQVGDNFFFDVHYKATGPNQIELADYARWLYLAGGSDPATQKGVITDFQTKYVGRGAIKNRYCSADCGLLLVVDCYPQVFNAVLEPAFFVGIHRNDRVDQQNADKQHRDFEDDSEYNKHAGSFVSPFPPSTGESICPRDHRQRFGATLNTDAGRDRFAFGFA